MTAGMQMQVIVRGYFVYDLTSSPLILGLVSSGFAVPMLIFALFGGELADRFPKRKIIQLTQGTGCAVALLVGISISTGIVTWIHMLASSLITGCIYAFMVPARSAFISVIVPKEYSGNAFALNAAAMSTTTLLAPAIAGNLYGWIGADGVYYTIAGIQLCSVFFTGSIRAKEEAYRPRSTTHSIKREIGAGLSYIRSNSLIIVLIVASMSAALLSMPFHSLLPVYVVDVFAGGPKTLGILVTLSGAGAIAGSSFIAMAGKKKRGKILIGGGLLSATGLLAAAAFGSFGVVCFSMIAIGLGDAFRRSLSMALIMEQTDREFQGRVSSVYTMNFGLMPLGTLPASALTQYFGVRFATMVLGVLLLGIGLWLLISQRRLRNLA